MTKCCEMTHKQRYADVKKITCPLWTNLYSELQGDFIIFNFFCKCDSTRARDTHNFTILLKFSKEDANGKKNCDVAICEKRNWFLQCENLHSFIFVQPFLLQALWERRMADLRSFAVAGVLLWGPASGIVSDHWSYSYGFKCIRNK